MVRDLRDDPGDREITSDEEAVDEAPRRIVPPPAPRPVGGLGVVVRPPGAIKAQSTSLKVQNVQAISARPDKQG